MRLLRLISWPYAPRRPNRCRRPSVAREPRSLPAEVKGVGLLIVNHTDRASDQWLWRPNIGREQRIALQDRSTRFFGTDFSFEDLEERDVVQFDYKLLGDEKDTWKLESKPRKSSQYTYGYLWIKKDNYTIVKVESYNKKGLVRVIDYRDFELAKGIWTARTIEVADVTRNSRTTLKYDKLEYNLPMKDDDFTLDALRRWTALPPELNGVTIVDAGARYPGRSQFGLRWNHVASRYEYSLSYFDGFNNLPLFSATFDPATLTAHAQRFYPNMRLYGADAALPLPWLTVKGETGYFTSTTPGQQDYVLYVIQVERQVKEWSLVGGYAGEAVTAGAANPLSFAPDLGFAKSFVGHATLTIDVNRSLTAETAVRSAGSFVRVEYSQAYGQHWRVTPGVAWIRGDMTDFLGQYHRNSYASLAVRYSF